MPRLASPVVVAALFATSSLIACGSDAGSQSQDATEVTSSTPPAAGEGGPGTMCTCNPWPEFGGEASITCQNSAGPCEYHTSKAFGPSASCVADAVTGQGVCEYTCDPDNLEDYGCPYGLSCEFDRIMHPDGGMELYTCR